MQSFNLQARGTLQPCLATARPNCRAPRLWRQPSFHPRINAVVADNGAAVHNGVTFQINDDFPPAEPEPVSPEVQAIVDEQGLDYEASGLQYLTNEARVIRNSELHMMHYIVVALAGFFSMHMKVCLPKHCHSTASTGHLCCILIVPLASTTFVKVLRY